MGKQRDLADGADVINFIDGLTSDVQEQLDTLDPLPSQSGQSGKYLTTDGTDASWGTVTTDPTLGTLTKTFTTGESSTINLTSSVLAPVVSVTKEVPQSGVTNNNWDVNSTTENYTRLNSAYATTLTPSSTGEGTFTLGTGSFAAEDVGKTIYGNSGVAILTASDGSYVTTTDFADTSAISSGSWEMYAVVYNSTDGDLELSKYFNNYDLSIASFVTNFVVNPQEIKPEGVAFNTDGTKMFVVGSSGDDVNEYTLSTGFDISTASFVDSFSVSSQDTVPTDVAFNIDGTKMFVCGISGSSVYEYTLSTGFDVSTASYVDSFSFSSQDTSPHGITFNTDGSKLFMIGDTGNAAYEYNLSTGFDISSAFYVQSFSVSAQDGQPQGIAFSSDGTKMFVIGVGNVNVYEYTLTTGFNISTASYSQSFSVSSEESDPTGITFSTDGTKMFVVGEGGDEVNEYSVGSLSFPTGYQPVHTTASIDSTDWTDINSMTADQAAGDGNVYYAISTDDRTTWTVIDNTDGERDIVRNNAGTWQYNSNATYASETWVNGATNTELATLAEAMEGASESVSYSLANASYDSVSFSIASQEGDPLDLAFKSDGTKFYLIGRDTDAIYQYSLSTAWDLSTASYDSVSFSVASQEANPATLAFSSDGTKMYVSGYTNDTIFQYTLSTAWDLSTASYASLSFSISGQLGAATGIVFKDDGTKLYATGQTSDAVFQYSLSTAWNISTASYDSITLDVSSEDTIPTGIFIKPDGTRMYITGWSNKSIFEYALSTAWDLSTASYTAISFSVSGQGNEPNGLVFKTDGTKMYHVQGGNDAVYQYSTGSTTYTNQMDKTQLDAVTDPNHIALGDDLDLSIIFNMTSGTTIPSSDGVAINYDANVLNKGAVLGTDYDFDAPAQDKVRITALAGNNLKVRIV